MKAIWIPLLLTGLVAFPNEASAKNCMSDLSDAAKVSEVTKCLRQTANELEELTAAMKTAIVAFEAECPAGWTRYAKADGRFILGVSEQDPPGKTSGERDVTLTVAQMPGHVHNFTGRRITTFSGERSRETAVAEHISVGGPSNYGYYTPAGSIGSAGNDESHPNMPPYIALYFCKKD